MKILITGTAGFIGYHLTKRLLNENHEIVGLDNINDYYDVNLKYGRLAETGVQKELIEYNKMVTSATNNNYRFIKLQLEDKENLCKLFESEKFDAVVNLAAQAGVRYSIENPYAYLDSNITGFLNILEASRHNSISNLVYASSSSVYGLNEELPFKVEHNVDHPISLYAASKKSNELMAHTYSYLYNIPTTGLRFFTVYGPWGRPDMALFIFTKAILEGKTIDIYNNGHMNRDFTYIDDIISGIVHVVNNPSKKDDQWSGKAPNPSSSVAPYSIYNIGNNNPVKLLDFIDAIEEAVGKEAIRNYMPIQPGDVPNTFADVSKLESDFNYKPDTPIKTGVERFVNWFKQFYGYQ